MNIQFLVTADVDVVGGADRAKAREVIHEVLTNVLAADLVSDQDERPEGYAVKAWGVEDFYIVGEQRTGRTIVQ